MDAILKFVGLAYIGVLLAAAIGWVMNLYAVVQIAVHNGPADGMLLLRLIGIPVAFVGAVLGYL